jgi:hypothetical protein
MERKRVAEAAKGVGRPKVGGPFSLLDQNGKEFTDGDMKGRYSLVCYSNPDVNLPGKKWVGKVVGKEFC